MAKKNSNLNRATTYERINALCAQNGLSINEVCRAADVDRSILERWKKAEPKTLRILRAIEDAIASVAAVAEAVEEPAKAAGDEQQKGRILKAKDKPKDVVLMNADNATVNATKAVADSDNDEFPL